MLAYERNHFCFDPQRVKGRPNFVTACLLFSKRVEPEQPPKVGGGGRANRTPTHHRPKTFSEEMTSLQQYLKNLERLLNQAPADDVPRTVTQLYNSELEEFLQTIQDQIQNIKTALEVERTDEINRINNTLKGIVNQLIVSLEALSSEKLTELIEALRKMYPS